MRPIGVIVVLILAVVVALAAYNYFNQPEPLSDRIDNAVDELGNGNLNEAGDELNNQTRGDKMSDDLKDMVTPSPSTPTTY